MNTFSTETTGSTSTQFKTIEYKMGDYTLTIKVNDRNEFVGVENIRVDKQFYSYKNIKSEIDVARYYEE